ncbi:MAG: ATP-binding cassette domain-containing protein [Anaeroplasmataceae bacterium]|nr:ATP-binding cassette domain-containing protein [Anaeroplasmataceae bacterium]
MSNTRKDGDFNLDEELRSKIAANEEGQPISDDHEEEKLLKENMDEYFAQTESEEQVDSERFEFEKNYGIHPKLKRREELLNSDVLLSVRNLKQFFFFGSGPSRTKLKAVSNISFDVHSGECFGIVGESGCGKTTTGRSIIKLYDITSGSVYYKGYRISAGNRWNKKEIKYTKIHLKEKIAALTKEKDANLASLTKEASDYEYKSKKIIDAYEQQVEKLKIAAQEVLDVQKQKLQQIRFDNKHVPRKLVNEIQMIFQDPVDSLDPRMTVEDIIQEGLRIQGFNNKAENHQKVVEMLEKVGLVADHASRYPHEFSGGQRQRIGIARALIMNPKLLICDEPISALDVSIRAQIINLLNDLKDELGLTIIFIAHDLSVVKYFCDRIAVMYFGKIVELASSDELFKNPLHPYTKSLLSAIPKPNPLTEKTRERIVYNPQMVHDYSVDKPELVEIKPGHLIYCNQKELEDYKAVLKD